MMSNISNKEFLDSLNSEEYKKVIVNATKEIMTKHEQSEYVPISEKSNNRVFKDGEQIHGITSKTIDIHLQDKRAYCNIATNLVTHGDESKQTDLAIIGSSYKQFPVGIDKAFKHLKHLDPNWHIADFYKKLHYARKDSPKYCPIKIYNSYFNTQDWIRSIRQPKKNAKSVPIAKPKRMNLMDFDKAKEIFYFKYLQPLFLREGKKFIVDEHNKDVLASLVRYFVRADSVLDINKGIMIYGKTGSGKSSLLYALSKFTKDFDLDTKFSFLSMEDLHNEASSQGAKFIDSHKGKDICVDEFAAERYMTNYFFKQQINVFSTLVEKRWSRYQKINNQITHGTTNINFTPSVQVLLTRYNGMNRELSRIKGMFNFVHLSGIDRRITNQ